MDMNDVIQKIETAFEKAHDEYEQFFNVFYPGKKSAGFNESNQVCKFLNNYRVASSEALTWMELSLGGKEGRLDGLVIDGDTAIFIEAKRLNTQAKLAELKADFSRALLDDNRTKLLGDEMKSRIEHQYILLLADIWDEKPLLNEWIRSWNSDNNPILKNLYNNDVTQKCEDAEFLKSNILGFETLSTYHIAYILYQVK